MMINQLYMEGVVVTHMNFALKLWYHDEVEKGYYTATPLQ